MVVKQKNIKLLFYMYMYMYMYMYRLQRSVLVLTPSHGRDWLTDSRHSDVSLAADGRHATFVDRAVVGRVAGDDL